MIVPFATSDASTAIFYCQKETGLFVNSPLEGGSEAAATVTRGCDIWVLATAVWSARLRPVAGYDPQILHRRSIRLPAWDYRERGAYFVTICTHERRCTLSNPGIRSIVLEAWRGIPDHFRYVSVDEFVIMPNHVHGIIWLHLAAVPHPAETANGGTGGSPPPRTAGRGSPSPLRVGRPRGPDPASLGAIVGSFKSYAAYRINGLRGTPGAPVWQRNYYERVIRSDRELEGARQYILDNPRKWAEDKHNPANLASL